MRAYELLEAGGNMPKPLPPEVAKAFMAVADEQRGAPEHAMLRAQHYYKGGVLSPVIEHIGDLVHRMTEHADAGMFLEDIIKEKVDRGLRYLTHGYGFEREMEENIRANGIDRTKLDELLVQYAKEHEKLPVYNIAHWHGREAAIALGYQKWSEAIKHLQALKGMLDAGNYNRAAGSYSTDSEGRLVQYDL